MTQLEPGLHREDIEIASTPPPYLNRHTSPDPDTALAQGQSYRARCQILHFCLAYLALSIAK